MERRLGVTSCTALVVANCVGAGVFTTSGFALEALGRPAWVLAAWVAGGAIALCGALSYLALARRYPISGGEYTFLSRMVHPLAGFLSGWVSLLAGFTAPIAAAALGLAAYVEGVLPFAVHARGSATAAIAAATLLHGFRIDWGVRAQNAAVGAMLIAIAGFLVVGAWAGLTGDIATGPAPAAAFDPGAFGVTLVWIGFAYSGWNAVVYVAGEVRDPDRTLPRAVWAGTLAVIAIYLLLNALFLYGAPYDAVAGRADVGTAAAAALGGADLRRVLAAIVALALFTSVSSMVLAGPRVYARMAADGLFPGWLRGGRDAPVAAVLLQGGLAIAVVWTRDLAELLGYIGFVLGLSAAATVTAGLVLRLREGRAAAGVIGGVVVPALFVAATLASAGFLVVRAPVDAAIGAATVLLGLPVYWLHARRLPGGGAAGEAERDVPEA